MKTLSDKEFKKRAEQGEDVGESVIRKQFACDDVKAINKQKRQIDFVISSETPDRMKDTIKVEGFDVENFKKNPVVLFAHDNREPPVAKAISIDKRPRKKQLISRAEFVPADVSPFAESLFRLYELGFMRATSVGFRPIKWKFSEDDERPMGIDFTEVELLEYSLVPIPANPDALISARQKGIDTKPLVGWAERVLDEWGEYKEDGYGLHVPRRMVEQLRKSAQRGTPHSLSLGDQMRLLSDNISRVLEHSQEDGDMAGKDDKGTDKDNGAERKDDAPKFESLEELDLSVAKLPQEDVDIDEAKAELEAYYKEFDELSPWEDQEDKWKAYVESSRLSKEDDEEKAKARALCVEIFNETTAKEIFGEEPEEPEYVPNDNGSDEEDAVAKMEAEIEQLQEELDSLKSQDADESEEPDLDELKMGDAAAVFLEKLDESLEGEEAPSLTRKEKRTLRNIVESLNELFVKAGEVQPTDTTKDTQTDSEDSDKSGNDGEPEELSDEDIMKFLNEKLGGVIEDAVQEELDRHTGKVK